jgi:hypothetical protein
MTTPDTSQQLLAQIIAIEHMETGKLSTYTPPGRSADSGPYYKLQSWINGKNQTRHVRPEELPALKEALEGYQHYKQLTEQYAQKVIQRTRQELSANVKKKIRPYSRHAKANFKKRSKR